MQSVALLGGSGSIGKSTLDVIARHPERYRLQAVSVHSNVQELCNIVRQFSPDYAVISDEAFYLQGKQLIAEFDPNCQVLSGAQALCDIAADPDTDVVMAAIVGAAGLGPSLTAARHGKTVLLANKEALVMSGQLFIDTAHANGATILPIDSEHNAIFQCLPADYQYGGLANSGISKLLLTGSGGPFLHTPIAELSNVTPAQACKHPNWSMGQKISVDSATMMNKGLEFIEACWLFGVKPDDIDVLIHPQSVIHSMVQYLDGSVLAQLGNPDMRTPIAHALAYPQRMSSGVAPLDFSSLASFEFYQPDFARFPNLKYAIDAMSMGQYATTALNASNEEAVSAFLHNKISFTAIARVNDLVLNHMSSSQCESLEQIMWVDSCARDYAIKTIRKLQC